MITDERIFRGQFGFDNSLRLRLSLENAMELRLVVEHEDGSAHIALDAGEVRKLRDALSDWLERSRRAPVAANRHS